MKDYMKAYRSGDKPQDQPGWKRKEKYLAKKKRLYKEKMKKRTIRAVKKSNGAYESFLQKLK